MAYGRIKVSNIEVAAGDDLDLTAVETKLDGIESGATADQTGAEIKTAYEAEADTNAYDDAAVTKLAGIEESATADQTGAEIKAAYEGEADTNAYDDAAVTKLAGIEESATADQTGAEIKAAYEGEANTNAYDDAAVTKLAGIAAGAEVNTVDSVAGKTGAVSLAKADVGLSNVDNTSDADKPVSSATQTALNAKADDSAMTTALAAKADLVGGKLSTSQIPELAVTEFLGVAASQSAMLALSGQKGDWCNRSDTGQMFIIVGDDPTVIGDWAAVSSPASPVVSVAGKTGAVSLDYGDINNTPTIPTNNNQLSNGASYATTSQLFSGSYNDLSNKPTIPTNNNQLTNGAGYVTSADGGNAGTLDGIDSSQFLRSDTSDTFTGTLSITGSINNSSTGGSSGAILGNLEVGYGAAYNSISAQSNNALHLNYNSTGTVYVGSSNTVWHSGNDGAGSGLDADTVDGLHASSFLRSDTHDVTGSGVKTRFGGVINSSSAATVQVDGFMRTCSIFIHQGGTGSATESNGVELTNTSGSLLWGGSTVWHSGNDGSGSGLDADNLDGYTWASSGKNVRASEFYADNWFRNYNSGEGLYNEADGTHWYSYATNGFSLYTSQSTAAIRFNTYGGATRGYVYATNSNEVGFLNNSGNWSLRCDGSRNVQCYGDLTAVAFRIDQLSTLP